MDYARRLMSSAQINSKSLFERLLAYFFSEYRTHFNEEDCKWFLSFSNQPDCPFSTMMIWFYLTKVLGIGKDESIGLFIPKVMLKQTYMFQNYVNVSYLLAP